MKFLLFVFITNILVDICNVEKSVDSVFEP